MLFQWLFLFFAFWWLFHALRPWLAPKRPSAPPPPAPPPAPPSPKTDTPKSSLDKMGEYIDYEELNDD
ncbi:MAG: hypothetical protein ABIQ93_00670 [Saprospiraceae bacterium]